MNRAIVKQKSLMTTMSCSICQEHVGHVGYVEVETNDS